MSGDRWSLDQPGDDAAAADDAGDEGGLLGTNSNLESIAIDPPFATIESLNGVAVMQAFHAIAHFDDGTQTTAGADVAWFANEPQVGSVDAGGLYTASGSVGGSVTVRATYKGLSSNASLTVKLHLQQNPGNVPSSVQAALQGASTPDPNVVWAYPYDGTVWPRGLLPPTLMWNGGAPGDVAFVHVKNSTFELEQFVNAADAPSAQLPIDPTTWQKLTDSSAGDTQFTVARWDGSAATLLAHHTWTIAPASMRGTIYYWSNSRGRVLRIKPGAAQPDDFANQPPLSDPNQYKQSSCLMACHTVSADGSTLIAGGGTFGGSYDLKAGAPAHYLGGTWSNDVADGRVVEWSNAAVSPSGKYVLVNAMAESQNSVQGQITNPVYNFAGLYTAQSGQIVSTSGVTNVPLTEPAWSPEGSRVVFLDSGDPYSWGGAWNDPPPGDLKVMRFDESKNPMLFGTQTLVPSGPDPNKRIAWPTVTPDGGWVVYARTKSADTRFGNTSDLYVASANAPNQEARLSKLDGDGYPFAAGSRDVSLNFEPSCAPVAAGGYFWVVFTSRRTCGNLLTGDASTVKQLWVAAIDEKPNNGQDPSHAPFYLPGQESGTLNMRGFWALDPCKGDGQGCQSGTDCCGGYCDHPPDGGALVCMPQSQGCAQDGDKCQQDSDCCNAPQGVTCINHVCSEPTPK